MKLVDTWKRCGACIGFCARLGDRFFTTGVTQMEQLVELLNKLVVPSYAKLAYQN